MRCSRVLYGLCILFVIAFVIQTARAQDDPNFEAGMKPYGTYHGGNIDTIDLSNGSLAIDIPLMTYPQRGGKLTLNFALHYENRGSFFDEECYSDDWGSYCWYQGPSQIGHGFNIIQKHAAVGGYTSTEDLEYYGALCTYDAVIKMSDGPVHGLGPVSLTQWQSTDGSGYRSNIDISSACDDYGGPAGVITGPDGTRYQGSAPIPGPTRPDQNYLEVIS